MKQLLEALQQIKRPGDFCTFGSIDPCFPGLEVSGVGPVGLPLTEGQAKELINQCSQAPFGKGEQTVVDTTVRCVWQLEPHQFQINNVEWDIKMNDLIQNIQDKLGLGETDVSCHLYKLLLYEEGSFFIPHRDTEKLDNMFATLVVVLPSEHEGGDLIIHHDGQEKKICFGGENSRYHIQYASFYADCKHEITPIIHGYRLCLIYNLALPHTKKQPSAPKTSKMVKNISQILKTWALQNKSDKLTFLFEHQYTQAGLSFHGLKNLDRVKAEVLFEAALEADCEAYLALVTLWESGSAEDNGYYGDYYNRHDQDDEDYEMEEVFDRTLSADHWIDSKGIEALLGKIEVEEDEIVAETDLEERDPDKQEVEGPTGNEGTSMERWYHRAGLIIWPKHRHFAILSHAGQEFTIPQLEKMVQDCVKEGQAKSSEPWQQCQAFAGKIIGQWKSPEYSFHEDNKDLKQLFTLLITIEDVALMKQFMGNILVKEFGGTEGKEIVRICKQYGWITFQNELHLMIEQKELNKTAEFAPILQHLCCQKGLSKSEGLAFCKELAEKTITAIKEWDAKTPQYQGWRIQKEKTSVFVESIFKALCAIDETELLEGAVKHFINDTQHYNTHSILIPALKNLKSWIEKQAEDCSSYGKLLEYCIHQLEAATAPIPEPKDWVQNIELKCKCEDCRELSVFLKDPQEQVHRFRVRKDRRHHLHQQISAHKCDMTHVTERVGSPQTLVCTKTRDTYNKKKKQQKVDFGLLADLQKIQIEISL